MPHEKSTMFENSHTKDLLPSESASHEKLSFELKLHKHELVSGMPKPLYCNDLSSHL